MSKDRPPNQSRKFIKRNENRELSRFRALEQAERARRLLAKRKKDDDDAA